MRMDRVRIGERIVLNDRGGVWEKIDDNRAKNVYGEAYGTEIEVLPDTPVYVHFGDRRHNPRQFSGSRFHRQESPRELRPKQSPNVPPEKEVESPKPAMSERVQEGIRIAIVDEDEKVITEIVGATVAQVAAYTSVEAIGLNIEGSLNELKVVSSFFNHENQTVYIQVRL
jgi:hypothetical protein